MGAVRRAKRWTQEQGEWGTSEWQRSDLPVQRFAAQHELDPQRVYLWRKRSKATVPVLRSKVMRPEVVEVKLDRSALSAERRLVIELVNGRRLSVAEGIDLDISSASSGRWNADAGLTFERAVIRRDARRGWAQSSGQLDDAGSRRSRRGTGCRRTNATAPCVARR